MKLTLLISIFCIIIGQWQAILSVNCNGLSILVPSLSSSSIGVKGADGFDGNDQDDIGQPSRHIVERLLIFDIKKLDDISNDLSAQLKSMVSTWDQTLDDTNIGDNINDDNNNDKSQDDSNVYSLISDDELPKLSFFQRAREYVRLSIAPARDYYHLVKRYRAWYLEYNSLIKSICEHQEANESCTNDPPVRSALDALQIEYVKVDQKLYEEAVKCKLSKRLRRTKTSINNNNNNNNKINIIKEPKRAEEKDFLLRALKLLIIRLEDNLKKIKLNGFVNENNELDELMIKMGKEEQDNYTRMAIERAKNIARRRVERIALREIRHLFKFVLFNSLANQVKNRDRSLEAPNNVLNYLEPIVLLLGDVETPVIVTYLRDIRFRLALSLVNHLSSIRMCPTIKN